MNRTPGMWQRSWAGLRRRILLRLRKSAKKHWRQGQNSPLARTAAPVSNNADPRSLSSITPPPQQPIPLPHPRLEIQPQRAENRSECTFCLVPKNTIYKNKSAQRSTSNTEAYRNQIGTVFRIQYRSIQKTASKQSITNKAAGRIPKNKSAQHPASNTEAYRNQIGTAPCIQHRSIQESDRHSVSHPISKHTDTSQHPPLIHNQELLKKKPEGCAEGPRLCGPFAVSLQKNSSYIAKM